MPQRHHAAVVLVIIVLIASARVVAQQPSPSPSPSVDANDPIVRIREEGLKRSQVMQTLSYLTDVIGPRLTGSPNMKRANNWTRDQLTKWGLQNAHLEEWGPFGRAWVLKSFYAEVVEPQSIPLLAIPLAWSPPVEVPLADVVFLDAKDEADLAHFKGQLRGKIVMFGPAREVEARFDPRATRLTDKQLLELADAGDSSDSDFAARVASPNLQQLIKNRIFFIKQLQFLSREGVALIVSPSRGDGGLIFAEEALVPADLDMSSPLAMVRSMFFGNKSYDVNATSVVPQIVVAVDQYTRIQDFCWTDTYVSLRFAGKETKRQMLGVPNSDQQSNVGAN